MLAGHGGQEAVIEATSTSPPRLPHVERQEQQPLLKGPGAVSTEERVATSGNSATAAGTAAAESGDTDKGSSGGGSDDGSRSSHVSRHHKSASGV